jgi:hypothetical protein
MIHLVISEKDRIAIRLLPRPLAGEGWGEGERAKPVSSVIAQYHPHDLSNPRKAIEFPCFSAY